MNQKEIICIVCPMGCQLEVSKDDISKSYIVKGNKCARGKEYGIKEMSNPTRVLTTTVMLKNAHLRRLPVRVDAPIPKELIASCMNELNNFEVQAPVKAGAILVQNILNTGANVISARSI
jgi:CxxC motif-containing protein